MRKMLGELVSERERAGLQSNVLREKNKQKHRRENSWPRVEISYRTDRTQYY